MPALLNRSLALALVACAPPEGAPPQDTDAEVDPTLYPERPLLRGAGGPQVTFTEDDLGEHCAYLAGNLDREVDEVIDIDHKNMVAVYRGHLVLPWSPEWGTGGLTFFNVDDPCQPEKVGEGRSLYMRETHNFTSLYLPPGDPHAGEWAATNMGGIRSFVDLGGNGVQFWDISDPTDPVVVSNLVLEGLVYPDSYAFINLAYSWAYPYLYVAGANLGVFVVDATDPTDPQAIGQVDVPDIQVGATFVYGDLLLVTDNDSPTHALFDISDPTDPQPLPGGRFESVDREGNAIKPYHANLSGDWALFARKDGGGGPIVIDLSDSSNPTFLGDLRLPGMSGGYVFYDEGHLFTGDSHGSHIIDFTDPSDPQVVMRIDFADGDLDTLTPYGNIAVAAVDDPASREFHPAGESAAIVPWRIEPDTTAPQILSTRPVDGATGVALTQSLYVGFNEFVEPSLAVDGIGARLREGSEDGPIVPCWNTVEESRLHVRPKQPLQPGTPYVLQILEGGLEDVNGNTFAGASVRFTTAE